jgi:Bacterial Ig-like domain
VITLTPLDNDVFVNPGIPLVMEFNEPIEWSVGSIFLVEYPSGVQMQEFSTSVNSGLVTFNGDSIIIAANNYIGGMGTYSILIDPNAIKDTVGNHFAGYSSVENWNYQILWESIDENILGKISYQNESIVFEKEFDFKLVSLEGKILKSGNGNHVDLANLAKGSYVLQLENQYSTLIYVH